MTATVQEIIERAPRLPQRKAERVLRFIMRVEEEPEMQIEVEEQKILDEFLELYGTIKLSDDFDEETDKDAYLRESYESID